ncbi:MAG TPA: hypothetical protein VFZ59_00255 [Verrucomicrobiae bacterium]|nr:hypothetical protein [Verrucomicrobiae bacterium]
MKPLPSRLLVPRRTFIKQTSIAVGASVFAAPYLLHAKNGNELQGAVVSGAGIFKIALPGASVRLYEATSGEPRLVASAVTNSTGLFSLAIKGGWTTKGSFYVTADLAPGLQLVTVLGTQLPGFVTLNELTTVAAGYAFAQFIRGGVVSGSEFGLRLAAGMNDNLVASTSGESSPVMLNPPNADQSNSLRSTRALANLLAYYVRNGGIGLNDLFTLATPPGGVAPANFLQALSNICRFPEQNVSEIYALTKLREVYTPALVQMPDAWTIVVKVNNTGNDDFMFGGPGNLAFDANGYAWVTNNVFQGTPYSCNYNVVLKPNGQPADGRQGTPNSILLGGGALGAGYGVSIAPNGNVWVGNFGWGGPDYNPSPDGNGSVTEYNKHGKAVSGALGYQGGVERAQGITTDPEGNIWICSFGNNRLVVFPKGDPKKAIFAPANAPFDVQIARDGTAWVTNSGGLAPISPSSVTRYALVNGQLQQLFDQPIGHANKALALDSQGNIWVASGGDSCVYLLNNQGSVIGQFNGGGIDSPWTPVVDGDDNIWVANFGPQAPDNDFNHARLTKLAGSNPSTRPPGLQIGSAISPASGYTLPSAGEQVLLHNGEPLYGREDLPAFTPFMRVTGMAIDQAGNVWAVNNWKPRIDIDLIANPGGDGICIFVGLAKPPRLGV